MPSEVALVYFFGGRGIVLCKDTKKYNAQLLVMSKKYNPQNEAFLHSRTSRAISQNETYRRNTPCPPLKNRPAYAGIHIL